MDPPETDLVWIVGMWLRAGLMTIPEACTVLGLDDPPPLAHNGSETTQQESPP
jgi:hypothetical protein